MDTATKEALLTKKENVSKRFKEIMQELYGERLAKIILYGSYARGDFHEESDIDFLVVLNEEKVANFDEIDYIRKKINRVEDELSIFISVNPIALEKFNDAKHSFYISLQRKEYWYDNNIATIHRPLLYFVNKEGIAI